MIYYRDNSEYGYYEKYLEKEDCINYYCSRCEYNTFTLNSLKDHFDRKVKCYEEKKYSNDKIEIEYIDKNTNFAFYVSLVNNIKQYKYWKQAVEYHKKYEYIGRHWEKAYKDGVDWIYHYVDRERLHNKTVDEIDPNDYDDEIWITDPIWSYSGPNYKDKLEKFGYSENYLQEQEKIGICN
jgi:hypothetical protein